MPRSSKATSCITTMRESELVYENECEGGDKEGTLNDMGRDNDSDIDELDFNNFKGIYFEEDPNRKY